MALSNVVDVQSTFQLAGITRVGFGTLLFVSEYDAGDEPSSRVLSFASTDEAADNAEINAGTQLAISRFFGGDIRSPLVKVAYKLDTETWAQALNAIVAVDDDWSVLAIDSAVKADIMDVAAWVQSRKKVFIARSADSAVLSAVVNPSTDTDVASTLLAAEYSRTALIYSSYADTDYPEMSWAGPLMSESPGAINWSFQSTAGIPADVFTGAQIAALEAKRVTRIENIQGLSRTFGGGYTSAASMYIDLIRGIDYHDQRMAEDLLILLVQEKKVPGDNRGSAMVENVMRARMKKSAEEGIFIDDDTLQVFVPRFDQRDVTDREARFLTGCTYSAFMQGAINKIQVRGTLRV